MTQLNMYGTKKLVCKHCGYDLDTAFGFKKPIVGTFSICAGCGNLARFNTEFGIDDVTEEEFRALPLDHQETIREMQVAVRAGTLTDIGLEGIIASERN